MICRVGARDITLKAALLVDRGDRGRIYICPAPTLAS